MAGGVGVGGVPSTLSQDLSASPEGEVDVVDLRKEGVCAAALPEPLYVMRGDIKGKIIAMSLFYSCGLYLFEVA